MSDITSTDFSWAARSVRLDNGFLALTLDLDRPAITSLRLDPTGRGRYSPNQLATGLAARDGATTPHNGALTQYVDGAGVLHSSTDARGARVVDEHLVPTTGMLVGANPYSRLHAITLEGIEYGAKRETWTIELGPGEPTLTWRVEEEWLRETEVTDCRTPAFWFAQRDDAGEPFHFQLLRRGMAFDDPYGGAAATLVPGGYGDSRAVVREPGTTIVATTYSRVPCDLQVTASAHLQRAAILNWWTMLGQTRLDPGPDADAGKPDLASGRASFTLALRLVDREATGTILELTGPADETRLARQLFATHADCALVANTRDGYLGNEPDGYHASMVSWMHARALLFASEAGPVSADAHWTTTGLMRQQLQNIADSTDAEGTIHSGYAADTALDVAPSFALSIADHAITTGDRAFTTSLLDPARRALDRSLRQAADAGGLLAASLGAPGEQSDAVIDYWDWLRRPGAVAYPNVLLFHALERWAEVEVWAGDPALGSRYAAAAGELRDRIIDVLWDDDRGCLAESALDGVRSTHLYTAVQYLAITSGLLDADRARSAMAAIDTRLAELGDDWRGALAVPTNLFDASALMPRFTPPGDEVVEFGHTMNGGSLLSWAYFEIGSLIAMGRADAAWARARTILDRFEATALLEGCNYWDHRGRPSRARLEPFLSDVVLVASALPRWFVGVEPRLDRIDVAPVLPTVSGDAPWGVRFMHLGAPVEIRVEAWSTGDRRLTVAGATVPVRVLERGEPRPEDVIVNGRRVTPAADGTIPVSA